MSATHIHHVNFLVYDLDSAIPEFENRLKLPPFEIVDHPPRGARIARSQLGESWFVLVAPYDESSVPGRHLAEHGEGFFLLSFGTDDDQEWRAGISDWEVADNGSLAGAQFQFTRNK